MRTLTPASFRMRYQARVMVVYGSPVTGDGNTYSDAPFDDNCASTPSAESFNGIDLTFLDFERVASTFQTPPSMLTFLQVAVSTSFSLAPVLIKNIRMWLTWRLALPPGMVALALTRPASLRPNQALLAPSPGGLSRRRRLLPLVAGHVGLKGHLVGSPAQFDTEPWPNSPSPCARGVHLA